MSYAKEHPKDQDRYHPKSHTNYKHLSTLEKNERMKRLHSKCRTLKQEINRIREKLDRALEPRGVSVDEDLQGWYKQWTRGPGTGDPRTHGDPLSKHSIAYVTVNFHT